MFCNLIKTAKSLRVSSYLSKAGARKGIVANPESAQFICKVSVSTCVLGSAAPDTVVHIKRAEICRDRESLHYLSKGKPRTTSSKSRKLPFITRKLNNKFEFSTQ